MEDRDPNRPIDGAASAGRPDMAPAMALALQANFGSVAAWREAFVALGQARGGRGGVALCLLPHEGRLVNQAAASPAPALAGGVTILALAWDTHAGPLADGAAASRHADTAIAGIDWARVHARYAQAVEAASEPLGARHDDVPGARLLDVRRAGVFEAAGTLIPGAAWRDPAAVDDWAAELPRDEPVLVYCVHGHEVSRAVALRLHAGGFQARFLHGGIAAWQAAGRPLLAQGAAS